MEIRYQFDDPDQHRAPDDLFDKQQEGLDDELYGKKDKGTTEQAYFTCNVCECDLKSIITLRAHCKGTQHIRKALKKKKEWRNKNYKKEEVNEEVVHYRTLFDWLDQGTSEAVVGLKYVTEFVSDREDEDPRYHCTLRDCDDAQGDAEWMKSHILSLRHRRGWLLAETGHYLKHAGDVAQRIAEYTKDYSRDYRELRQVRDRRRWVEARDGRVRPRDRSRSPRRDREATAKRERKWEREEERQSSSSQSRDGAGRRDSWKQEQLPHEERRIGRGREVDRWGGNTDTFVASTSLQSVRTEDQDVRRFHKRVAEEVMKAMNKYYYDSNDCVQKKDEKIRDRENYKKYAKRFSTELEEQFKESYEMVKFLI